MKNKSLIIFLIVILSILVILIGVGLFFLLNTNFSFKLFGSNVSDKVFIDEEFNTNYKEINIDSTASDIEIKESSNDKIKVIIYSDDDNGSKVEEKNDELFITTTKTCKGFCFNKKIDKVELYIPSDYENNINIKNKYGDVEIGKLAKASIEANMDAGDIEIESIHKANIDIKYGDVEIDEINDIKLRSNCGDVKIDTIRNYLNIELDKGDIEIDVLNIEENSSIKNNMGDIEINKTNDIYIDADTDLGDNRVKNNSRDSDIVLKIRNNLGDIKVN